MTTLRDEIWLHVGARPPSHLAALAGIAPGLAAQGPSSSRVVRDVMTSRIPTLLQHDGSPQEPGLFDPDDSWLMEQPRQSLVTSQLAVIGLPGTSDAEDELVRAITSAQRFSARVSPILDPGREVAALWGVDYRWLASKDARRRLTAAMSHAGVGIAIMLSKDRDPLDSARAVEGLIDVVSTCHNVRVLRCDHGALGAYACGAVGGSIGLGTGARHFVPQGASAFADRSDPTPRVFLPVLHAWWKGSLLASFEDDPLFGCHCGVCNGAHLSRFQDESLSAEADAHSVSAWTAIARELATTVRSERRDVWIAMCSRAYAAYDELEDRRGLPQPPSKQLKAWLRVAGVTAV